MLMLEVLELENIQIKIDSSKNTLLVLFDTQED